MAQPLDTSLYSPTRPQIAKVRYTHAALVDLMIARPHASQGEWAAEFGYSEPWLSNIIASDAFQEYLAQRRTEIVDPTLLATVEDNFKGLMFKAQEILQEKLCITRSADLALRTLELSSRAMGYGARGPQIAINQQFVVEAPRKAASGAEWVADAHALLRAHQAPPDVAILDAEPA